MLSSNPEPTLRLPRLRSFKIARAVVITTGFGVQVALLSELRHRRALQPELAAVGGAGATASGVGMVACCAHHLAELVPLVGLSGVAVFLTDYRAPIMLLGVAVNLTGVFFAARALAKVSRVSVLDEGPGGPRRASQCDRGRPCGAGRCTRRRMARQRRW